MSIERVAPCEIPSGQMERIGAIERQNSNFIFLDTASPGPENRFSYLFVSPVKVLQASNPDQVPAVLDQIEALSPKFWIAGYMAYEAARGLEKRLSLLPRRTHQKEELLWFGVFQEPWIFDHCKGVWNKPLPVCNSSPSMPAVPSQINFSLGGQLYDKKLKRIKDYIASGDTYQVNFTFNADVDASDAGPFDLYMGLRRFQKVPFCAYYKTPSLQAISFSPELFFRINKRNITVKPMKGTAQRGRFEAEDKKRSQSLLGCQKNRSENIMIVDLLRNDLGRICTTKSVKTTELFQIETHRTVHQMTSTVKGRLKKDIRLRELFKALFPCGSVTGAPKIRTMEIIDELETGIRGIYCGALGFLSPQKQGVFSVPIRTLWRKDEDQNWNYRVGSGIVWESQSADEFRECGTKCRFLTEKKHAFVLFESILYKKGRPLYLRDHLLRLQSSARFFRFRYNKSNMQKILSQIQGRVSAIPYCKVRISLEHSGDLKWEFEKIDPDKRITNRCLIASGRIDSSNTFLFHKTSIRSWYAEASEMIRKGECWDVLHLNERNQVTEGARSTIFIQKGGTLLTPPVECGLLDGVLRRRLIRSGRCREKVLKTEDLFEARAVYCGNSVRGLVEVTVG